MRPSNEPRGLTVDRARGRLYWSNFSGGNGTTISYASLGVGGGDGDLLQVGSTGEGPDGVAIDPVTDKIYWSDYNGAWTQLAYANVDGSNVQGFDPGSATVLGCSRSGDRPGHEAGSTGPTTATTRSPPPRLAGGGQGQDLDTSGATINGPDLPSLARGTRRDR